MPRFLLALLLTFCNINAHAMPIFVRTLTGTNIALEAEPGDSTENSTLFLIVAIRRELVGQLPGGGSGTLSFTTTDTNCTFVTDPVSTEAGNPPGLRLSPRRCGVHRRAIQPGGHDWRIHRLRRAPAR